MRSSEETVASILNTVGALIIFLDPQGRVVRFNSACEALTGFSAVEMEGRYPWDALAPFVEREGLKASFERLMTGRRPTVCENHWITKTGESRLISWSNTVLLDPSGEVEFVIGTGIDITDRLRLEREIIEVSEEERRRIGHELHERLCNHLAGTALMMEALAGDVRKGNRFDLQGLEKVTQLVGEAVEHARLLARGLIPVKIEEEGLVAALLEMSVDVERISAVPCQFIPGDDLPELAHMSMATHLYRIAQEAVDNAVVHAKPTHILVRMYMTRADLVLSVKDDGVGMPVEPPPTGIGLHMMRYRARMIGGTLTFGPHPNGGSEVKCIVPAPSEVVRSYSNGSSSRLSI